MPRRVGDAAGRSWIRTGRTSPVPARRCRRTRRMLRRHRPGECRRHAAQHAARLDRRRQPDRRSRGACSSAISTTRASTSTIQPGGPNNDGVAIVASGRYEVGQVSSSPSLMLAASQDLPIKLLRGLRAAASLCVLLAAEEPGAHAGRLRAARRSASRRPASILLRALLAKNNIDAEGRHRSSPSAPT